MTLWPHASNGFSSLREGELNLQLIRKIESICRAHMLRQIRPNRTDTGLVFARGGPMEEVVEHIQQVSLSPDPVLVWGPSGVGKELVCRSIHKRSGRSGPYRQCNSARWQASDSMIIQSTLFGVGPNHGFPNMPPEGRPGLFELANQGTVLFDEVHLLPLSVQGMLLRFLEEGTFERAAGELIDVTTDVRIISATTRDLEQEVAEGRFLFELYQRLVSLELRIPPLRERREDILVLIDLFLALSGKDVTITDELRRAMLFYDWHGNVRQLRAFVRGAITCLTNAREGNSELGSELSVEVVSKLAISTPVKKQIIAADAEYRNLKERVRLGDQEEQIIEHLTKGAQGLFLAAREALRNQQPDQWRESIQAELRNFSDFLLRNGFPIPSEPGEGSSVFTILKKTYADEALAKHIIHLVHQRLNDQGSKITNEFETSRGDTFDAFFGLKLNTVRKSGPASTIVPIQQPPQTPQD